MMIADAIFHLSTILALCIVVYLGYSILSSSESLSRSMYAYKLSLFINATVEGLGEGERVTIYSPLPVPIENGRIGEWTTPVRGNITATVIRLVRRGDLVEVSP